MNSSASWSDHDHLPRRRRLPRLRLGHLQGHPAMTCPACADTRHRVVDSRPAGADGIMRRRLCRTCGLRWTTVETAAAFAGTPVRPLQRWLAEMTAATTAVEQALAKVAAVLNNRPLLDARTHPFADVPPSTVVKRLKRRVHP